MFQHFFPHPQQMRKTLMCMLCLLLATAAKAQTPLLDSKVLLDSGIALHERGEYKKAIAKYRQINESDTNYHLALYEEALSLIADSSFEEAKGLVNAGLNLRRTNKRELMLELASIYDYTGKQDSAFRLYDEMKKLYPHDNQPYYESGLIHFRNKDYDKAARLVQRSMVLNPDHFRSHYMLGLIYLLQGRLSEAMIALQVSLLMTNNTALAKQSITLMNSITEETDEIVKLYHEKKQQNSHPLYDEIDELVNSKLALKSEYTLKVGLNDNIFRQIQVIAEKLKYSKTDTSFVTQYYVPLLADVYGKDKFEPYVLLLFSDYGFENVDALAKKRSSAVADVKTIVFPYFANIKSTRELNYSNRATAKELYHYYLSDKMIVVGLTDKEDKNKFVDEVTVFDWGTQTLESAGRFNKEGKKEGKWLKYYADGKLMSKEYYKNGTLIDSAYYYYRNGNLGSIGLYDKQGVAKEEYKFDYAGWLSTHRKKISEKSYEEQTYYANGQKELAVKYDDDKIMDGPYTLYYDNGKIKKQVAMKDGEYDGILKLYHENGKLSQVANYAKGTQVNSFEEYYETGKLKEKYSLSDGKENGPYEEYYDDGKLKEKGIYRNGFKEEMHEYSEKGKEYGTIFRKEKVPVSIKYVNEEGATIYTAENKKGLYKYSLYHATGNKAIDVTLNKNGNREGLIIFYSHIGVKNEESFYHDGDAEGKSLGFNDRGDTESSVMYHNDKKDGYSIKYYNNHNIKDEGWYKNGQKQGLWKRYYANGQLKEELYYLDDVLTGTDRSYNIHGVLTDKEIFDNGLVVAHVFYDTAGIKTDSVFFAAGGGTYKGSHWKIKPTVYDIEYSIKYGDRDGACKSKYIDGSVCELKYIKNGSVDSNILYFPEGSVWNKGSYRKGEKIGKWEYFNEAGELTGEENYNTELKTCVSKSYICGRLYVEYNKKDDEKDGMQTYYGDNGRIAYVLIYDNGDLVGYTYEGKDGKLLPEIKVNNATANIVTYYGTGQKSGEVNFVHNMVAGAQRVYYTNGSLAEERTYDGPDLNGPFRRYTEDGTLVYDIVYKDDEEQGIEHTLNKNGKLIKASYYYGSHHGPTIVTDMATKKSKIYHFYNGELINTN